MGKTNRDIPAEVQASEYTVIRGRAIQKTTPGHALLICTGANPIGAIFSARLLSGALTQNGLAQALQAAFPRKIPADAHKLLPAFRVVSRVIIKINLSSQQLVSFITS